MECAKCGAEMKAADMLSGMHQIPVVLSTKKNSVWDSSKVCAAECYVCPQCGYIELKAAKPELFQNI